MYWQSAIKFLFSKVNEKFVMVQKLLLELFSSLNIFVMLFSCLADFCLKTILCEELCKSQDGLLYCSIWGKVDKKWNQNR